VCRRINDIVKYPVYIDKDEDNSRQPYQQSPNQVPPQCFQVIHETHFHHVVIGSTSYFIKKSISVRYWGSQSDRYLLAKVH